MTDGQKSPIRVGCLVHLYIPIAIPAVLITAICVDPTVQDYDQWSGREEELNVSTTQTLCTNQKNRMSVTEDIDSQQYLSRTFYCGVAC